MNYELSKAISRNKVNNYEFNDSIGRLTMVISRNIGKLLEMKFEENGYDITAKHWTVIAFVYNYKSLSQKQLVELSGLNKVMINRLIDTLEENGWMIRNVSPEDRRVNNVGLTDKGLLIYSELSQLAAESIDTSYGDLPKENIELGIKLLHQISTNLAIELDEIRKD